MVRPIQRAGVVIPANVLRDQNAERGGRTVGVGFRDVLRICISALEAKAPGKPLVQQGLQRVVLIGSGRQQARNAGGVIGYERQRLAGSAAAKLSVIQVHTILQMHGMGSDITDRREHVEGELSLNREIVRLEIAADEVFLAVQRRNIASIGEYRINAVAARRRENLRKTRLEL